MKKTVIMLGALVCMAAFAGIAVAMDPLDDDDWDKDPDMDGLNNLEEYTAGSDPNNWDTDGDSLPDGWEAENELDPTDPTDAEGDNDYFGGEEWADGRVVPIPYLNIHEYFRLAGVNAETGESIYIPTDPNNEDTDGDGVLDPDDSWPWDYGEDPNNQQGNNGPNKPNPSPVPVPPPEDSDSDGLPDDYEREIGTDPYNPDTDGDGLMDPMELVNNYDPNDWDTDNDMLIDGVEMGGDGGWSTDGHKKDSDNDGTNGGPGNPVPPAPNPGPPGPPPPDSDHDGLLDDFEREIGTDPYNPDTDGDGLMDPMELVNNYDPNDWDTDNDMLIDGVEMGGSGGDWSTDGHTKDSDNDGVGN